MKIGRLFGRILIAAAAVEAALCVGLYWAMRQPPDTIGRVMKRLPMPLMPMVPFETLWTRARAGRLNVGDAAPDFRLPTLDHKSSVQLASLRGVRPVVLVFGSYT